MIKHVKGLYIKPEKCLTELTSLRECLSRLLSGLRPYKKLQHAYQDTDNQKDKKNLAIYIRKTFRNYITDTENRNVY